MMNLMLFFFTGIDQLFTIKPAYLSMDRRKSEERGAFSAWWLL